MNSVLIVDDERNIIEILEIVLQEEGLEVFKASSAREALDILRSREIDVVISDIRMPDLSGVDLLREAQHSLPDTTFIMMTAFASTDTAIEALQHGACDYLTKPFKMEEMLNVVRHSLQRKKLKNEVKALRNEMDNHKGRKLFQALSRNRMVGRSSRMVEVYRTVGTVADGDSTVLITGESGTGKELVARTIHDASHRKERPFVSINCGAFPETLLESELFGYMKGAFTGAAGNKKGLFEAAHGGSIFLDEIGDMTPAMQVNLLRVLQERKLRPLGGTGEVDVDVRVIAATNRNLQQAICEGRFREDLYYRIAVIQIEVPPLRDRAEDIELLAFHFLGHYARQTGRRVIGISREALRCLQNYSWPGNVRELENTLERAVALETAESIQPERLPEAMRNAKPPAPANSLPQGPIDLQKFLAETERHLICQMLEKCAGNQTEAAKELGLTRPSLRHRIQVLGINASAYRSNGSES